LETQVNAIESAHFNAQTVVAMRQGAKVLQLIHKQLDVNNVEDTMEDIREQMEVTQEIANAISNPVNVGLEGLDDVREA
jgi:charged multivesicular body protein 4